MKKINKILLTIALVLAMIIACGIWSYNSLVEKNNLVDSKWSQVENVMQRRYDLIPNLQSAVKGAMQHETKVFGELAEARKSYSGATTDKEKLEANDKLNNASNTLINVIHESYPELSSNKNVNTLMIQLEGSENRISTERRAYILAVQSYNNKVQRFPTNLYAGLFGFNSKTVYKAEDKAQKAPSIDLSE